MPLVPRDDDLGLEARRCVCDVFSGVAWALLKGATCGDMLWEASRIDTKGMIESWRSCVLCRPWCAFYSRRRFSTRFDATSRLRRRDPVYGLRGVIRSRFICSPGHSE